ncbi:MAG: histidine kinase, partial [Gammaproteobacteria bacterium]
MIIEHLSATDALTDKLVRVFASQHPRDVPCPTDTVRAVFADDGDEFLGLVGGEEISRYPHRIFADLLSRNCYVSVAAETPLRELAAKFEEGCSALAVLGQEGTFMGVVTHTSLLDALLRCNEVARRQAEKLLALNRRLTQRLFATQEEERLFLARELHDEMGQYCTAIVANLQAIIDSNAGGNRPIQERCDTILELCDHVHATILAMLRRLRPALLDEVGLRYALQELVGSWSRTHSMVNCHLELQGALDDLGESVNIALYRIIQECLTNVARHAHAREVVISLQRGAPAAVIPEGLFPRHRQFADVLMLAARDDGQGFADHSEYQGLGLSGIRERV